MCKCTAWGGHVGTVTAVPLASLSPRVSKCSHVGGAHGHSHRRASRPVSQSLGAREAGGTAVYQGLLPSEPQGGGQEAGDSPGRLAPNTPEGSPPRGRAPGRWPTVMRHRRLPLFTRMPFHGFSCPVGDPPSMASGAGLGARSPVRSGSAPPIHTPVHLG